MKKILTIFSTGVLLLTGCADLIEPAKQNFKDISQMENEPDFAMGFLTKAYSAVHSPYVNSEYATDDAVVNANSDSFRTMSTGGWTSTSYNPLDEWSRSYAGIQYINQFLAEVDNVNWTEDAVRGELLAIRMKGEAHGLRGILHYQLLRAHSGYDAAGNLLGVPYLDSYLGANDNMNLARPDFKSAVESIKADLEYAVSTLPYDYEDQAEVPAQYTSITTDVGTYNRAMGVKFRLLVSGRIAQAYLARLNLLAASDGFANTVAWADAANAAAPLLDDHNGVAGIFDGAIEYYAASIADKLSAGSNPPEIIWRGDVGDNRGTEENFFPPSVNGNGRMNPSQNLVDAFPMANGYPISNAASGYDAANPYAGRDPRLDTYILHNNSTKVGVNGDVLNTTEGSTDGINGVEQRSSRTGYYMKKRCRMDVNLTPGSQTNKSHYEPRVRYTEIYLIYAEAANEAWGPNGKGGHAYSAYDVIKAIRQRAGVGGTDDPYLEECATSKEKMRELIRNERRLELCFENTRFWDLRRWKCDLNTTVKGINWKEDGTYEIVDVETLDFQPYMNYMPIPNSEILKYSNLQQNAGW